MADKNERNLRIQKRINKIKTNMLNFERIMKVLVKKLSDAGYDVTIESKANGKVLDPNAKHYADLVTKHASLAKIVTELEDKLEKEEQKDEIAELFNM